MVPHVLHSLVGVRGGDLYKPFSLSIIFFFLLLLEALFELFVIGVLNENIKFFFSSEEESSFR
jgi:hypothetical protein